MKESLLITVSKYDKNFSRFLSLFLCFILSMNLSGQKIYTMLGESWVSNAWLNSSLTTNTYDVSGYLTNSLDQTWDIPSTSWVNTFQTKYTNNPDGTVLQTIYQTWAGGGWLDYSRSTNTYNTAKKVLTTISETKLGLIWQNSTKIINTYDGSTGYLNNTLKQTWDIISSTFKTNGQTNYTNNPDGTVSQSVDQTGDGITWTNLSRVLYTYTSGKFLTIVSDIWTAGNWLHSSMETYTYDGTGKLTLVLSQLWDTGLNNWKDDTRSSYTYNLDGTTNIVTTQKYDGVSTWNNTNRVTFGYSPATAIPELAKEAADLSIYPNPATDVIRIESGKSIHGSTYSITDQAGKIVLKGKLIDENPSIDISTLPTGIYFLYFGEGSRNSYKVIKNRSR
jgi:hypothetical protein